jgi:hypothetical protein
MTLLEPAAVPDPDEEELDPKSPKKLLRRDQPLDPPPDEDPRVVQLTAVCGGGEVAIPGEVGAATPGDAGWQLLRGISA